MRDDSEGTIADLADSFAQVRRMAPAIDSRLAAAAVALVALLGGHPAPWGAPR